MLVMISKIWEIYSPHWKAELKVAWPARHESVSMSRVAIRGKDVVDINKPQHKVLAFSLFPKSMGVSSCPLILLIPC